MRRITVRLGDYVEEQKRRDRRGGRIVAALAIAAALVIAMSGTTTTPTPAGQNGGPAHLAMSSAALQFAPQLAGTTSPAQLLQLRNDGGTALTIAKVDVDNKAFQLSHDCAA